MDVKDVLIVLSAAAPAQTPVQNGLSMDLAFADSGGDSEATSPLLASGPSGVSANSFIQTYATLTSAGLSVTIATPTGASPSLTVSPGDDPAIQTWLNAHKGITSTPAKLEALVAQDFRSIVIPSAPGALTDLATSSALGQLLKDSLELGSPIAAIGHGAAALLALSTLPIAFPLKQRNLTGASVAEDILMDAQWVANGTSPCLVGHALSQAGAQYSSSSVPGATHVVIDRQLITGQNTASTALAVQNLLWLLQSGGAAANEPSLPSSSSSLSNESLL